MILVCFAVAQEAKPFKALAQKNTTVIVTGMGPAASAQAARKALAGTRPDLVLTCGFAGGLDPSLEPLSVLYSSDEIPSLRSRLEQAGARPGRFFCSDRTLSFAKEKAEARTRTAADAVEMESGHIREICREMGFPSATVRVILDPADADLPLDFNAVLRPDQQISPFKLAGVITRNPLLIPALLELGRQSRAAAEKLARVLARVTAP